MFRERSWTWFCVGVARNDLCNGDLAPLLMGFSADPAFGHLRMQGNQVFKHAVINISEAVNAAAADAGIAVSDVDWFIPHQANQRILNGVAHRLGIDEAKVISTVAEHANTSAASIPLALDEAVRAGRIQVGDTIAAAGFGAGVTWGSAIFQWG